MKIGQSSKSLHTFTHTFYHKHGIMSIIRKAVKHMKNTLLLNKDEQITLFLLAKLNNDILVNGITTDNMQTLKDLQAELLCIVQKYAIVI